jgi:hypothetical protein
VLLLSGPDFEVSLSATSFGLSAPTEPEPRPIQGWKISSVARAPRHECAVVKANPSFSWMFRGSFQMWCSRVVYLYVHALCPLNPMPPSTGYLNWHRIGTALYGGAGEMSGTAGSISLAGRGEFEPHGRCLRMTFEMPNKARG